MSARLFDGSDDDENETLQLGTNKDYAKSYNNFRKKELLKKYKDRGLDVSDSELNSSSDSSEDEEEVDNPEFDKEFFKTLSSLKSKNPSIYDKNTRFFEGLNENNDETDNGEKKPNKKSKPVTLKDYERKLILERNGKFEDDSDAEINADEQQEQQRAASPTAVEAERRLRAEFEQVMAADDDSEDEEFGGIFKKRTKTKTETEREEEDFANWLAGKKEDIEQEAKAQLEPLKNYWNNGKLTQGERFLRDYILNKGYSNTNSAEIPTYDEIVGDIAPLSEDEQELEKQAEFEHKYNFRYEEPDAEFVKRYPRTIENSLRRTDDSRKKKREEQKERKQQEKQQKMKEIEMLKEMKRKEIEEKIRKLKAVTGNDELGFKDEELEEDFDPDAHDRRMQELFNDEFYQVDEGEDKPECPSDIDELQIEDWDNYDPKQNRGGGVDNDDYYGAHCEDDDFNMDCDYDPAEAKQQLQQELIENTKGRKGRKGRRNRFKEMIEAKKPAFNPEDEQDYGDYIDEYYKLDCEDIIGDVPCRFKYVETTPNDFGLTIEEILLAKNKELNQWASLKKAVQLRPDYVEKKEQRLYKMKAKNEDLKRKIFKSLYGEGSDNEEDDDEQRENVQAKPNTTKPTTTTITETITTETTEASEKDASETKTESKAQRRRKRRKAAAAATAGTADVTLTNTTETEKNSDSQDKPPMKKLKLDEESNTATENGTQKRKKKKNRKKSKKNTETTTIQNGTPQATQSAKQSAKPTVTKSNPFKAQKTENKNQFQERNRQNNKPNGGGGGNPFKPNKNATETNGGGISDERLKAYGINPRKFHKKQKYGNKQQKNSN